ncbi:MAG: MGMT family protein [Planctomycetes bacterium]|nr:MGMT family protein [Planctomycetota bacterium]
MSTARTWHPGKGGTWRAKLDQHHPNHGRVMPVPRSMRKAWGTGTILIPRPRDVDTIMRSVRKGRLITVAQIRQRLARAAGADGACPLTTGIFVRVVAEAAEEDARDGRRRITPYWRTVKDGGKLNEKYPGGAEAQARRLREEGFEIERNRRGQPARVKDYESYLVAG